MFLSHVSLLKKSAVSATSTCKRPTSTTLAVEGLNVPKFFKKDFTSKRKKRIQEAFAEDVYLKLGPLEEKNLPSLGGQNPSRRVKDIHVEPLNREPWDSHPQTGRLGDPKHLTPPL